MQEVLVRILAGVILYGAAAMSCGIPDAKVGLSEETWVWLWAGVWGVFMVLLVIADRSLYHLSFRMIGANLLIRLGGTLVMVAFVSSQYHRLTFLEVLLQGRVQWKIPLEPLWQVGVGLMVVGILLYKVLQTREKRFIVLE